ncbi:MAG: Flp pilus assembly protein CpaB [Collinsella sp.]|nr:Flp pilus assembly protein CpaB [Collinsella sp.]
MAAAAIAVSVGATAFSGMRLAESSAIIAKNETDSVNVVVTTRDVAAGETISESDLETQSVPKAYCPTDAATKVSDVAGHTSITTQTAGTSISLSSIQASASPAHITSAIEDGHVAIALSLDSSHGLSPLLAVGDRVNVLAAVSDGTTSSTETICDGVKVVALDSALTGTPEAGYSLVTLDVTPEQAAAIVANPNVTLTAVPHAVEEADDAQ